MKFFVSLLLFFAVFISCYAEIPKESPEQILHFWFTDLQSPNDYPEEQSKIWFNGGPEVDQEIRERFESLLVKAKNEELIQWKETPRGRLALIILLDQFSRNIYRGTAKAFAFDAMALQLALEGLELKEDLQLYPIERAFFYLPLEHAEDLSIQELSLEKFFQLAEQVPSTLEKIFHSYAKYAKSHYETIVKFGRFPHRNAALGRESTEEEIEFLRPH